MARIGEYLHRDVARDKAQDVGLRRAEELLGADRQHGHRKLASRGKCLVVERILGNFLRTLALPGEVERRSLTSLREKLVKIGAKVIAHGRYAIFQMAEVAVARELFGRILERIARLRPPDPAPC